MWWVGLALCSGALLVALSACGGTALKPSESGSAPTTAAASRAAPLVEVPPAAPVASEPIAFTCGAPANRFTIAFESSASINIVDAKAQEHRMLEQAGPSVEYRVEIVERTQQAVSLVRIVAEKYQPGTRPPAPKPGDKQPKGWEQAFHAGWVKLGEPFLVRLSGAPCLLDSGDCHAAAVEQAEFVRSLQGTLEALNGPGLAALEGRTLDSSAPIPLPPALAERLLGTKDVVSARPSFVTPNVQFSAEQQRTVVTQKRVKPKDGSPEFEEPQNNYWTTTVRLVVDRHCQLQELETTTEVWTPLLERTNPELPSGTRARRTARWRLK